MKASEIRKLSAAEMDAKLAELKKELLIFVSSRQLISLTTP